MLKIYVASSWRNDFQPMAKLIANDFSVIRGQLKG